MSDFDKEAEREKLRKKYERDKRDREATQRMSDLLLKGATMTNTHCDTCADPLFRQNGVTFCPSCHGGPEAVEGPNLEDDAEGGTEAEADADPSASADGADVVEPSTVDEAEPAGSPATPDADATGPSATPEEERSADADSHTTAPRRTPPSQRSPARRTDRPDSGPRERPGRRSSPPADADLETARASLTAALERFASEAAETDDPRYARDCLEAAREAAEALAVLGR